MNAVAPIPRHSLPPHAIAAVEFEVGKRQMSSGWWASWRATYDAHVRRGEQAEARQAAAIDEMRAGWARDAEFVAKWNAMSVEDAVAFVRSGYAA